MQDLSRNCEECSMRRKNDNIKVDIMINLKNLYDVLTGYPKRKLRRRLKDSLKTDLKDTE